MASQAKVKMMVSFSSPAMSRPLPPELSLASFISRMPSFRRTSREKPIASVESPKPPSWMQAKITPWPKGVHSVKVSPTTRPVTQVAEVMVNRASMGVAPPTLEEMGSISSSVPTKIISTKLMTMTRTGGVALILSFMRCCNSLKPGIADSVSPFPHPFSRRLHGQPAYRLGALQGQNQGQTQHVAHHQLPNAHR